MPVHPSKHPLILHKITQMRKVRAAARVSLGAFC